MILTRIQEAASRYPDNIAVQMKTGEQYRKYTYRELLAVIAAVARALSRQGIAKGDRVAILSENRPEWMVAYLAAAAMGAVVVPLDAQLTGKEVAVLLAKSDSRAVCVSSSTRQKLPKAGPFMVISFDPGDAMSFADMMKDHIDAPLPPAPVDSDLAAILFTSGTTGDPKGVMLTHGNLSANLVSVIHLNLVGPTDNMLLILPLHHTYPAMACMLLPLSLGATVTVLNSLKGPDILAVLQETGVSILLGVPQLFSGLRRAIFDEIKKKPLLVRLLVKLFLAANGLLRRTFNVNIGKALFGKVHAKFGARFRLFASGGARLDPDVYTDMSRLGFIVIEGYGLTETSPVCTFNPLERQKAGSIGIPIPGVEVRIANPDETGQGELIVRGANVMAGYYRKPDETAEVMKDGWFHTGDLGYRDRDGYFFITGRSKEMIVLSTGKKVFPEELEKFYKQIPSIKEICLLQTDRGLEAAVVPDFDYLRRMNMSNSRQTIADEIEDLAKELPSYKRIMGLKVFKESLPVTRLGKLKRALVKDLYLKGGERAERAAHEGDAEILSSDVGKAALACIAPFSAKKTIVPDDNLELDLGLDSLARVELVVSLEQTFGLSLPDSFGSGVFTIKDVVLKVRELLAGGAAQGEGRARPSWAEILKKEPDEAAKGSIKIEAGPLCSAGKYILVLLFKMVFRLLGGISVQGVENLPARGPYIITPNHLSNADAPLLTAAMPWNVVSQTYYLGHTAYFGGPITSRIAKVTQVIPVDMETRLYSALQLSAYVLRQGRVLCVFPEGTRSRDGKIKEFKKGVGIIAKELNLPMVPVAIKGTYDMMPAGRFFPRPGKVSVSFGRPVYPGNMTYEEITRKLYEEVLKLM